MNNKVINNKAELTSSRNKQVRKAKQLLALILFGALFFLSACGGAGKAASAVELSDLSGFSAPDLSGYAGLEGYEQPLQFAEVTVKDVDALMKEKKSFVLMTSFANCPWCNAVISYVNDVALEEKATIALIDTRKDSSWQSNLDLLDYDLFVEDFGEHLDEDEDGIPHLYVPHVFFVKDGNVVYEHQGALPEMGSDAHMELNEEQKEALRDIYRQGFQAMQ